MPQVGLIQRYVSQTWKCALIGGLVSLPVTISLYWLSGMGNELSFNTVFVGGLLAGFLAKTRITDADGASAGLRAGIVGGAPTLWILAGVFEAATALSGPLWFRSVALVIVIGTILMFLLGFSALVGFLGAKVGGWLAERDRLRRPPFVSN